MFPDSIDVSSLPLVRIPDEVSAWGTWVGAPCGSLTCASTGDTVVRSPSGRMLSRRSRGMTSSADHQSVRIVFAAEVAPDALFAFFAEPSAHKRRSLSHRSMGTGSPAIRACVRVALCGEVVAGYRAAIPNVCLSKARRYTEVWAPGPLCSPRFSGRGLQRLLDQRVMEAASLPDELSQRVGRGGDITSSRATVCVRT